MKQSIDTFFDFTTDSYGYWDNFWSNNDGLGGGNADPDSVSKTLRMYHRILWSRQLPNGEVMDLKEGSGPYYLTWKAFRFGSDAITTGFRYYKYRYMIDQVAASLDNYHAWMESLIRRSYSIGGMIIFPKRPYGLNPARGCNTKISDRWDLTLECIRLYYKGEESPLYETINKDKEFFDLFVDFKGYVDFFYLQDCVTPDYSSVVFWEGDGTFRDNPRPENVEDYFKFIDNMMEFVEKRNRRIAAEWGRNN